jgi:futalosine hydrolase
MKILIVSATPGEISPLLQHFGVNDPAPGNAISAHKNQHVISFLATGVGMVNTTYYLLSAIRSFSPDLVVNAGIAGSFSRDIKIGEVVFIAEERFSELGAEDDEEFLSIDDLKLGEQSVPRSQYCDLNNPALKSLRKVKAITVNKVHGNQRSIGLAVKKFNPDVESMEGAAFMLVSHREKVKHFQLRAVSNYVEKRNRESWDIPLAVKNLNEFLIDFLRNVESINK